MCALGDYGGNCFQSGDTARFNPDGLSATRRAQLQQVSGLRQCFIMLHTTTIYYKNNLFYNCDC